MRNLNESGEFVPQTYEKDVDFSDYMGASFESAIYDGPIGSLVNTAMRGYVDATDNSEYVSAGELNKQYGDDLRVPFTSPTRRVTADYLASISAESKARDRIRQAGDEQYGYSSIFSLGTVASIAGSLADPLGWAIGGVVGKASLTLAAKSTLSTGVAKAATAFSSRAATGALSGAEVFGGALVENVLGSVITEPLTKLGKEATMQPYGMDEALANIAFGSIFEGTVVGASRLMGKYMSVGHKASDAHVTIAAAQIANGKSVDVSPIAKQIIGEEGGNLPSAFGPSGRSLEPGSSRWAVSNGAGKDFAASETNSMFDSPFEGVHTTSSKEAAHSQSQREMAEFQGTVHEVQIPEYHLDIDKPLPEGVLTEIAPIVGKILKSVDNDFSSIPGIKIFNALSDAVEAKKITPDEFKLAQKAISSRGFDGVTYKQDSYLGHSVPEQTISVTFDKAKMKNIQSSAPDPNLKYTVPRSELDAFGQQQNSIKSDAIYDEKIYQEITDAENYIPKTHTEELSDISKKVLEINESKAGLDPDELIALEKINEAGQAGLTYKQIAKNALACLLSEVD